MNAADKPSADAPLHIARAFALQSAPLVIALVLIMTLSAPLAFYVVRVGELRGQARGVGAHLAAELSHEVYRQPSLWKYNSDKLLRNVRLAREPAALARIVVLDERGVRLAEDAAPAPSSALVWEPALIGAQSHQRGTVWVAVSLHAARSTAWLLMLPFLAVGLLLAGLLYALLQRAHAALTQRDERLQTLSRDAAELQERERLAIGRDLHDATGQTLTAIRLSLQVLQQRHQQPAEVQALATSTLTLADTAIDEIRRAVGRLGPAILGDVGLLQATSTHCRDVAERTGLAVTCCIDCDPSRRFGLAIETALYRVLQEALHNVVRHASAQHATVTLHATNNALVLIVDDDGTSAELGALKGGRGLTNMRERAELLGGTFSFERLASGHTQVRVELPI